MILIVPTSCFGSLFKDCTTLLISCVFDMFSLPDLHIFYTSIVSFFVNKYMDSNDIWLLVWIGIVEIMGEIMVKCHLNYLWVLQRLLRVDLVLKSSDLQHFSVIRETMRNELWFALLMIYMGGKIFQRGLEFSSLMETPVLPLR